MIHSSRFSLFEAVRLWTRFSATTLVEKTFCDGIEKREYHRHKGIEMEEYR